MIISISGLPGSGKSTIAKMLAEKLGFERFYMGAIMRQIADDKGITLLDLMKRAETDSSIDEDVDKYVTDLGKQKDDFIIESRTAFYFIPQSFKVFVKVDFDEAAKRIWKDLQKNTDDRKTEERAKSVEELIEKLKERNEVDIARYQKYYGFDFTNESNYDFVINSTNLPPEEVFERVLSKVERFKDEEIVEEEEEELLEF